jgi:hypothetical protein
VIILISVYSLVLYLLPVLGRLAAWSDILCVHSFVSFLVLTPFIPPSLLKTAFLSCIICLSVFRFFILWGVDPLLGNNLKQVPTATNQHAITEELLEAVFSVIRSATVATQRSGKHTSE